MVRFFGLVICIVLSVTWVIATVAGPMVETNRPFFWSEAQRLATCADPGHCLGSPTPAEAIAILGREPTARWLYSSEGFSVSGEVLVYGDHAGYAIEFNFRDAPGEQHPHLYLKSASYPAFLDEPN